MATLYPNSIQDLDATRGTNNDKLSSPNHVTHHTTEDDTIEALQAKVGIDGSAVTTSHDYKLSGVTGSDKAASKTGTETLTNKTLSTGTKVSLGSDATGDVYYNGGSGTLTRLAVGSNGKILKVSSNLPSWQDETVTNNASTTVAGIVEVATQSEVDAGTSTGGTGAYLTVTPDTLYTKLANGFFGDGSDGNITINSGSFSSGPITTNALTRDAYFNNLTINSTYTLDTNGFRIFVKGTLTFEGTGKLINNGGSGGTGAAGGQGTTNASGGTAGTAASTGGSLPDTLTGAAGGAGATAASGVAGSNGTAGTSASKSLGSAGAAGGTGATGGTAVAGTGPGTGGTSGAAGSQTGTVFNKMNSILGGYYLIDNQPTIVSLTGSASSGGGGGGGGGKSANAGDCGAGGGGGGSGAPGGIIWVSAKNIITVNGNIYAQADGGAGGTGGAGGNSTGNNGGGGGGGGGGAGGSGGVIIIFYYYKTGTGTLSVAGGSAGSGGALGTKHGTGTDGSAGNSGTVGSTGQTYLISIA